MRLLSVLVLGCLLSNGIWGMHAKLGATIERLFQQSESKIAPLYDAPDELQEILNDISEVTPDNFFTVLQICACSYQRDYLAVLGSCLKIFRKTKASVVSTCLYYFEEMFCVEDTHKLNPVAGCRLRTRVWAMIIFLRWSKISPSKRKEIDAIISSYLDCLEVDPSEYERPDLERPYRWTWAAQPEWSHR